MEKKKKDREGAHEPDRGQNASPPKEHIAPTQRPNCAEVSKPGPSPEKKDVSPPTHPPQAGNRWPHDGEGGGTGQGRAQPAG